MKNISKAIKKMCLNYNNKTYNKKIGLFLLFIIILISIVTITGINIFADKENSDAKLLAYFYDGENHSTPPSKDSGYVIDEVKCDKAVGTWDSKEYKAIFTDITGKFSCTFSFKPLHPYHKLQIDPNGGTYIESPGVYELHILEGFSYDIVDPSRKGHTFDGWQITGDNSYILGKSFSMGTEDTTIKARWNINTYNVEIKNSDLCDGTYPVKYNNSIDLCTPTRVGYTFAGWDITSGMLDGDKFIVDDSDATITAKWQINNYDYIVYHMQQAIHGDYILKDVDTYSSEYNSEVSPETRNYEGFTSPSRKTILITTRDNEVNYQYTRNKYTLTINSGTGVTYNGQTSKELYYEETTELSIPSKTGYNFMGWDKTSGEVYDNTFKMGASDATLTPKWEAKKYIVTFNANGGSLSQSTKEVTYDQPYGDLANVTRTGYDFLGWYTDPTGGTKINSTDIYKLTNNQTLYAHWKIITYNITINTGSNVSKSASTVNINYGSTGTVTITPSAGYYLSSASCTNGYTTNATTGTSSTGFAAQTITIYNNNKATASTCTFNVTLGSFTVNFNSNGGNSPSFSSKTVTYNNTYGNLPTVSRNSGSWSGSSTCYRNVYTFAGWYTSSSGGSLVSSSTTMDKAYNHTLYAHWNRNEESRPAHYANYIFDWTLYVNDSRRTWCRLNISCSESGCSSSGFIAQDGYQSDCDEFESNTLISGWRDKVWRNRDQSCVTIFNDSDVSCVGGSDPYCDY